MKGVALLISLVAAAIVSCPAGGAGTPPKTTLTTGPLGPTNSTVASFMFFADQPGSSFSCALDSTRFGACTSPMTYAGLADGQHTFYVYATQDGEKEPRPASWSWTVDTAPPTPVSGARAGVGYGRLLLSWAQSADTDHVVILRSIGAKTTAAQVYAGNGHQYGEHRFVNALEHRYSFVSYDKAGNVSPAVEVTVKASSLLLAPADGTRVRSKQPPALRWRAIRWAGFYNVQLWEGRHKILSAWPHRTSLRLGRAWVYKGHQFHLEPGLYAWYVWPGYGAPQKGTYGRLIGTAAFIVR